MNFFLREGKVVGVSVGGGGVDDKVQFLWNAFNESPINIRRLQLKTHMTVLNTIDLNHWLDFMNQSVISKLWPYFSMLNHSLSCALAAFQTFNTGLNDSSYSDQQVRAATITLAVNDLSSNG